MKHYKPIACHLHDHIEHFATIGKEVTIVYMSESNQIISIITRIKDWINIGNGEFVILESGLQIRLDFIHSIDNVDFGSDPACQLD